MHPHARMHTYTSIMHMMNDMLMHIYAHTHEHDTHDE